MRIEAIKCYARCIGARPQLLVKVVSESGQYGWGESGLTGQESSVESVIGSLAKVLQGTRVLDTADLLTRAILLGTLKAGEHSWQRFPPLTSRCTT